MKVIGNEAFKAGKLQIALDKYQKGLRYLHESPDITDSDPKDTAERLVTLKTNLNLNSALLQLKLKHFDDAVKSATYVLEESKASDTEKAKAHYRRALALAAQKGDEEAKVELEAALKLVADDSAVINELSAVKKRIAERTRREKAAYKNFFE